MGTTVKFQATSCFHRVLWQITIFVLFKLSKNQENSCQGYVLCKDIFVISRSTRGPISRGPIFRGPLFSPKLRGGCRRGLSQYAFRGNPSTAARKYVALAVCHRSRPLRADKRRNNRCRWRTSYQIWQSYSVPNEWQQHIPETLQQIRRIEYSKVASCKAKFRWFLRIAAAIDNKV